MAVNKVKQIRREEMHKSLNVSDLFSIGYADLGASIYYALGLTAFFALGATPLALALAGIVFVCTALSYAELSSMYHEAGGSASFARHAFNDVVSFIAGWGLLLDYIVTIAISAFAASAYLLSSFRSDWDRVAGAVSIITLIYIVNYLGIKKSARLSIILVSLALSTQLLIIGLGYETFFNLGTIFARMKIGGADTIYSPSWHSFFQGTAMAMVAYTGIESIAQLGTETKNPARSLPKAILIIMAVLLFVYLGVSLVAMHVIQPELLGTTFKNDPIAGVMLHLPGGKILVRSLSLITAGILLASANTGLIGSSRLTFNMGQFYQLPRFFSTIHPKRKTPYIALAFFAVIAASIVIASRGRMDFLGDLYNFGAMIAFFFAHLSLIALRIKQPQKERPFRSPFNIPIGRGITIPISAIIGVLVTATVWVMVVITKPEGRYLGLAWIAFGLVIFFAYRHKKGLQTGHLEIKSVDVPEYRALEINNILVPTRGGAGTQIVQLACELAKLHSAKITAFNVLEIPYALPFEEEITTYLNVNQDAILDRAEAIGNEMGVQIATKKASARVVMFAIIREIQKSKAAGTPYDLVILGSGGQIDSKMHQQLKQLGCRVLIYTP